MKTSADLLTVFVRSSSSAELCVTDVGRGEAVVFLHAGVADRRMWAAQQAQLQSSFRTVAYDRRGFGRTRVTPEPYDQLVDLLRVLDSLAIKRAVLVGCSLGGRIATQAALAHPDRVRALVVIASAPGVPELAPNYSELVLARHAALALADAAKDVAAMNRIEAQLWLDGPDQPEGRVGGPVRELFLEMNGIGLAAGNVGESATGPSMLGRLGELRMPVLLVPCGLDYPAIEAGMREMARQIPRAVLHRIDACAHLPSMERPAQMSDLLSDFLRQLPSGAED